METPPKVIPVRDPEEQYLNKSGMPPIHKHLPQIDGFGGGLCFACESSKNRKEHAYQQYAS